MTHCKVGPFLVAIVSDQHAIYQIRISDVRTGVIKKFQTHTEQEAFYLVCSFLDDMSSKELGDHSFKRLTPEKART